MVQNLYIDAFAYYTTIRYTSPRGNFGPFRSTHCRIDATVRDCLALHEAGASVLDVTVERDGQPTKVYTMNEFFAASARLRETNEATSI